MRIALLTLASLVFFTDYVARLDGLKDPRHSESPSRDAVALASGIVSRDG